MTTTEPRMWLYADGGRVADAIRILSTTTTLSEHVSVHEGDPLAVEVSGSVPFDLWGSGTQSLWRLASSITSYSDTVSLYEVMATLDRDNTRAVAAALHVLCGGAA